jgi:dienelactone hydrolase
MWRLVAPAALLLASCGAAPADPSKEGPYRTASADDMTVASTTGDTLPVHVVYPTGGPEKGPYPIVVFGHGFQIPVSQYTGYLNRLATFGYVALTVDYPDPLMGPVNNVNDGRDLAAGLDWALGSALVGSLTDIARAGVMGHSRGGKAAVLAAVEDARFRAVYGVDPVDTPPPASISCDPVTECPTAYLSLPSLHLPTLFVGETLDGTGNFACAPAAGNYAVFYDHANAPSIEVTVKGASHMSFVADPIACGVVCQLCQTPAATQSAVLNLAYAYAVAFFERTLRDNPAYDTYLTGAVARARYVDAGVAAVASKD